MAWLQLGVQVEKSRAESLEQALHDLGASAVTLQDAADEAVFQLERDSTPLWRQVMVSALFPESVSLQPVLDALTTGFQLDRERDITLQQLPEQDWERAWMADFKPIRFGRQLWICPSWCTPPEPEATNIVLDPGLAFGSGTHPTTALCLEWLDAHAAELRGQFVIDYGCGSGVLAIAAALLGAKRVLAIDNDPQAILACQSNRALNNIEETRLTVCLPGEHETRQADVLLANILSGPLQELVPTLASLLRPGGRLLLSGVLSRQTEALLPHYGRHFAMAEPVVRDEWVSIEGTRLPE